MNVLISTARPVAVEPHPMVEDTFSLSTERVKSGELPKWREVVD